MPDQPRTPPAWRIPRPAGAVAACLLLILAAAVLSPAVPASGAGEGPNAVEESADKAADADGLDRIYQGKPVRRFLVYDIAIFSILRGAKNTLLLTVASMPLAVVIGVVLALMRRAGRKWLAWPAATYVEVMRGTPLLVQVYVVFFSLPLFGELLHSAMPRAEQLLHLDFRAALTLNAFTTGIICLAANYAAYEAEIIRAGLEAVDRGQREAALSLGMTERQAFFLVVLPQAFRIVVPPLINDLIAMLKDTCLVSCIGVPELLERAKSIGKERATTAQMMVVAAVVYLLMSLACYFLGKYLEKRLKVRGAHELHLEQLHGH